MTDGMILVYGILELGCILGIGCMYDWRAGVTAFLGTMLVRIAGIDSSTK